MKDLAFSRAGEWMLDNFYVVKQTFRQIEEGLPASFINQLPKLDGTPLKGHPRIFALAWEWIGYSQGQIDLTQAAAFVQDYQQVTPLTIGELWALPIMLRIGILERLVLAAAELTGMDARPALTGLGQSELRLPREAWTRSTDPASPIQVASPPLPNETIVANCFLSLRLLSATDWKDFFEQTSRVEQILRDDPAEIYAGMDFDTRNSYRSVIEELARHSTFSEEQVALAAIEFRPQRARTQFPNGKAHVGYYLRDAGRAMLENSIRYQPGLNVRIRRVLLASPTATYLGSIAILALLFLLGLLAYATLSGGSLCPTDRRRCAWVWIGSGGRHHIGALDCDPPHQAPKPAAHGFFGRHPAGLPHHGGGSDPAGKRRRTQPSPARVGTLLSIQSRSATDLCPADRFR